MITLDGISKGFKVAKRGRGALAALGSLVHREYETVQALDGISFRVAKGEIVGYIGPNGAGKSTSIKVMGGILTPDTGTCSVMGFCPWKDRRAYVGNIGVVFGQRTQLWWDVPVQDSFDLLRAIYRIPEDRYRRNVARLADMLDMGGLLATPLRQLSLGQRMRCEVAASLLHDPAILFLDEPTIGLDAVSKLKVRAFIKELNRETGVTVLLTTHDMNDIEALTDRIILIGRGRVLYDGSMTAIRRQYDRERSLELLFTPNGGPPPMPEGVTLASWENGRAILTWDTAACKVGDVLAHLGPVLDIQDLSVTSRPVEEIIAQLYREYRV